MPTFTVHTHKMDAPATAGLTSYVVLADTMDAANESIADLLDSTGAKGWTVHSSIPGVIAPCGDVFEDADDARSHEATCGACAGWTEQDESGWSAETETEWVDSPFGVIGVHQPMFPGDTAGE